VTGRVILLCGLPGSGKTTEGRRLAASRGAVRMCPDEWMAALDIDRWDQAARARIEALQWSLTLELLPLDVTVVVEWGLWSRAERDALRGAARASGASIELRFLDVPLHELWRRVAARNVDPDVHAVIDQVTLESFWDLFEAPTPAELVLFDPA
jgi:predicted kinase